MKKRVVCGPPGVSLSRKAFRIMRTTALLLLITISQAFGNARAQGVKLDIELKDARFAQFMEQVRRQSDFTFFFNDASVLDLKEITLTLQQANIEVALEACLRGSNVAYRIKDQTIILYSLQQQQENEVRGRVVDAQGAPLVGATVKVVDGEEKASGPLRGTVTNAEGEFVLRTPSDKVALEISFVGYVTRKIPVANARDLARVVLQEETRRSARWWSPAWCRSINASLPAPPTSCGPRR